MWTARVFTLYPELFPGPLGSGLYKRALEKKLWSLEIVNIRDYAVDKHRTVDDTPFGGGSGMLMRADVIANSLDKNISNKNEPIIYLSPKGKKFDQIYAKKMLDKNINIICGHFEGIDQRLLETREIQEISIDDIIINLDNSDDSLKRLRLFNEDNANAFLANKEASIRLFPVGSSDIHVTKKF